MTRRIGYAVLGALLGLICFAAGILVAGKMMTPAVETSVVELEIADCQLVTL